VNYKSRAEVSAAAEAELCRGSRGKALSHCLGSSVGQQQLYAVVLVP